MKKPEFISLLNEYVDEISDPKNKAEHEAYLKQLEQQGELPPGRKLLRPAGHSCLKTFTTSKRKLKVFINLCMDEEIKAPNLERVNQGGNWQLPYAMGHPRHDQDNKKKNCFTFDIAFHPMAFQISESSSKFMKLLCDTAVSGANQLLQSQGEKVSEDYKLMKNLKCKGGTPGSIMVAVERMENPETPVKEREKTYKLSEEGPKLYKELVSSQIKNQREQEDLKIRAETKAAELEKDVKVEEELKKVNGLYVPKHKVVYSSPVDLGEFIENRYKAYKRPKEVVVTVAVPLLESLADCKIDVKEKHLVFDVKGVYYLEVKLDFDVVEDKASAKFDRKRKELKITLPIEQVPEVIHQIPDDVPLEVDEEEVGKGKGKGRARVEECEENKESLQGLQSSQILELEQRDDEGLQISRFENKGGEGAEGAGKGTEATRGPEGLELERERDRQASDRETGELAKRLGDSAGADHKDENNESKEPDILIEHSETLKETTIEETKKTYKPPKVSPCCIQLNSPLLFSLY